MTKHLEIDYNPKKEYSQLGNPTTYQEKKLGVNRLRITMFSFISRFFHLKIISFKHFYF